MGDLRNKFAKQEREAAHTRWMAQRYPSKPPPDPIRCQRCGQDHYQVTVYAIAQEGWPRRPDLFYCEPCAREDAVWRE